MATDLSRAVGITTTIPIEIPLAAGHAVTDLNNLFISDPDASGLVTFAERAGFPQSSCAWIKGLYGTIHRYGIKRVVGVTEGDCSDTGSLLEILESENIDVIPFGFPRERERALLQTRMRSLASHFGTTLDAAREKKIELDNVRKLAASIDQCAWQDATVTSFELFDALLCCSDMLSSDLNACRKKLGSLLETFDRRKADGGGQSNPIRLGCMGVPTILSDLWTMLDERGARVVYHETPYEFSRICSIGSDLVDSYLDFSYPYDIFSRCERVKKEIATRRISGVIHYVQSFCHRQIQDRIIRERLGVPVLTLEGDRPGDVDGRTKIRVEAFLEQLSAQTI